MAEQTERITPTTPVDRRLLPGRPVAHGRAGSGSRSSSRARAPVDELRPAGTYGAAFVSYEPGSPLTYSELLVARLACRPSSTARVCQHHRHLGRLPRLGRAAAAGCGRSRRGSAASSSDVQPPRSALIDRPGRRVGRAPADHASASVHRRHAGRWCGSVQGRHLAARHRRHRRRGAHRRPLTGLVEGAADAVVAGTSPPTVARLDARAARQLVLPAGRTSRMSFG